MIPLSYLSVKYTAIARRQLAKLIIKTGKSVLGFVQGNKNHPPAPAKLTDTY